MAGVMYLCLDRVHLQNVMVAMFIITKREDMEKLYQGRAAGGGIGGVGEFGLMDDGRVCRTSVNRHTFATRKTVGQKVWKR